VRHSWPTIGQFRAEHSFSHQTVSVLTLVIKISTLLSSIPYLQLFVDQYVEDGESFSFFVKVFAKLDTSNENSSLSVRRRGLL
jgi:hypothetical protein